MAYLNKLFKFQREENYEEFIKVLAKADESLNTFLSYKPDQKVVKDGDGYKFIFFTPNGEKEVKFVPGVPFEENIRDLIKSKSTITVDGDTFTHVQDYGPKGQVTFIKEFTPNSLKVTLKSSNWDGAAYRYYSA